MAAARARVLDRPDVVVVDRARRWWRQWGMGVRALKVPLDRCDGSCCADAVVRRHGPVVVADPTAVAVEASCDAVVARNGDPVAGRGEWSTLSGEAPVHDGGHGDRRRCWPASCGTHWSPLSVGCRESHCGVPKVPNRRVARALPFWGGGCSYSALALIVCVSWLLRVFLRRRSLAPSSPLSFSSFSCAKDARKNGHQRERVVAHSCSGLLVPAAPLSASAAPGTSCCAVLTAPVVSRPFFPFSLAMDLFFVFLKKVDQ